MRIGLALALSSAALGGCAYDMYGDPYGYGYGGASLGYYGNYGYGPYGYRPYGYGYGSYDPFGWYGDYYYPGVGIYVYDSYRNRHIWNDSQRRYWMSRGTTWQSRSGTTTRRENWSGFNRTRETSGWRRRG